MVSSTTVNSMLCRIACEITSVWCSEGGPNWSAEESVYYLLVIVYCYSAKGLEDLKHNLKSTLVKMK